MNPETPQETKQETKVCKSCGSEIPAQAKVCPYCNKKQSHKVRNTILIILGVIVVLGVIGAMFGGNNNSSTTSTTTTDTSQQTQDTQQQQPQQNNNTQQDNGGVLTVGQQGEANGVVVGLADAGQYGSINLTGGLQQPAPSGEVFVVLGFQVSNQSDSDQSISTASFEAYCDNQSVQVSGYTYMVDKGFTSDFSLAPGRETSGFIIYEVPQNWQLLEVEFKPNMFLNNTVNFQITPAQCG